MKKFSHSISTMMLLVALTGMGLASCSESPEAPEDPTENSFHRCFVFSVVKWHCKCSSPYPPTYATGLPCPD